MIIGNLTRFYYKKKLWLTPRHPLCFKPAEFKIYYSAAIIIQAQLNETLGILHNFELERLLYKGLDLTKEEVSRALQLSRQEAGVIDFLYEENDIRVRYYLMLDCINVSMGENGVSTKEMESLRLFAKIFELSEADFQLFYSFIQSACQEDEADCRRVYQQMLEAEFTLSLMDLKYYLMTLYDTYECTQENLEQQKELHLVDRCQITEDLVLKPGMRLILDHAIVRVYGNIALQGGELIVEHSKIIRKSSSHRACVNVHQDGDIRITDSEIDCRNQGMFLRAENGRVVIENSEIYNTTRGAAIRFWGKELKVTECYFHHCYSADDGGGIMFRGGIGSISDSKFRHCEAQKGGAIYGVEKLRIQRCRFEKCYVSEFGAAVYYAGAMKNQVSQLEFVQCFPEGAESVQYLSGRGTLEIEEEQRLQHSTIFDCPVSISSQGSLHTEGVTLYLNYPIQCRGNLTLSNTRVISNYLESGDMFLLEHAQGCQILNSQLDGRGKTSGMFATGTRLYVKGSMFRNMKGGRAIYNALSPVIEQSIFNYCQNGGISCRGGSIKNCHFVNCRDKNGAGIMMTGKKGMIEKCRFVRCTADYHGGGIDRALGVQVVQCEFQECRP